MKRLIYNIYFYKFVQGDIDSQNILVVVMRYHLKFKYTTKRGFNLRAEPSPKGKILFRTHIC